MDKDGGRFPWLAEDDILVINEAAVPTNTKNATEFGVLKVFSANSTKIRHLSVYYSSFVSLLLYCVFCYMLKQLFASVSVNSGRYFRHYSPAAHRIIV